MNDGSSNQGWAICIAAGALALLFTVGVLNGSYLALAIPVAILTLFVLGLAGWVGYTIATVQVEPAIDPAAESTAEAANSADDESSVGNTSA